MEAVQGRALDPLELGDCVSSVPISKPTVRGIVSTQHGRVLMAALGNLSQKVEMGPYYGSAGTKVTDSLARAQGRTTAQRSSLMLNAMSSALSLHAGTLLLRWKFYLGVGRSLETF